MLNSKNIKYIYDNSEEKKKKTKRNIQLKTGLIMDNMDSMDSGR